MLGGTVDANIVQQGLDLMIFGMGTVFVFLTILVLATAAMSHVITRYFSEPHSTNENTPAASLPASPVNGQVVEPRIINVIQEAVNKHRAQR